MRRQSHASLPRPPCSEPLGMPPLLASLRLPAASNPLETLTSLGQILSYSRNTAEATQMPNNADATPIASSLPISAWPTYVNTKAGLQPNSRSYAMVLNPRTAESASTWKQIRQVKSKGSHPLALGPMKPNQ